MSNKYKDSMNKIAMDEDMKNRIITNLRNMQDINNIKDKNNIKCIKDINYGNAINSMDVVDKYKISNSGLKVVRNLGMYVACFAVVLGGMAIKPFMSVPNLDNSSSKSSNIVESNDISNSLENNSSMNDLDINSSEDSDAGEAEVNESYYNKNNQNNYRLNEDKKAQARSIEDSGRARSSIAENAIHNGSSDSPNYLINSEESSSSGVSQENDNAGSDVGKSNINDKSIGTSVDNNSNNVSSVVHDKEGGIVDKNNALNNEVSRSDLPGVSIANITDKIEGRNVEISFDNLDDLKEKVDFDFKVCEVLENNYIKSEINLVLNEIVDITYTNNDNSIEFKTCEGKKDISGLRSYENNKSIRVDDVNFNLKGNGSSVKAVEWYEENMSYSIQSSKDLTSKEALEIAESLKTFK